ncbi:hydroxymethylpyrimidine/phosphomethylpyrimidine kinase, partial [Escherichia coli]|uniref:bifunctional hydroxymethylpyrimidine kinase/phosphomethylpyrimidine kinase n=1 Tax=Escherichia coli TaxID=562 RepID=UPI002118FA91
VLRAGGGAALGADTSPALHTKRLRPRIRVITPTAAAARRLAPQAANLADCGTALLAAGCRRVLITGGDEPGDTVVNQAYGRDVATRH